MPLVQKNNSKCIKNLNTRYETINYIKENTCTKLRDLGHKEHFVKIDSEGKEVKAKIYD